MARWWLISRVWTHATEYLRYICGNKIKKWRFFRDFVRLKNTTYRSRLYFIRFYSFLFRKSGAVWRWSWFVWLQRGSDRRRWWAKPSMEINSALTASGRTYSRDFLLSLRHDTYAVDMEISSSICLCKRRISRIKQRAFTTDCGGLEVVINSWFVTIRADRDEVKSRKSVGGGLGLYVEKDWTVEDWLANRDARSAWQGLTWYYRYRYF